MSKHPQRQRDMTVADVAERAGVGKSTASRALGGYGSVSEDVRDRVLAAADELGYRPNELARSMNTGRSRTLGVIVGDITNPYFSVAMRGISDAARRADYDVILANTSENLEAERHAVRVFLDKRVDALIVAPSTSYEFEHLDAVRQSGRPLVLLDRRIAGLAAHAVQVRIAPAAREATTMLLALGHRRIGFVSALQTDGDRYQELETGVSSVTDRLAGFIEALATRSIDPDPQLIRYGAVDEESTTRILRNMITLADPPTAVIASDSNVAIDVLLGLETLERRVPEDVSVIAFDDAPWARVSDPPLTALTHPIYDAGVAAATTALRLIDGLVPPRVELAARLTERSSHAAPAAASLLRP